MLFIRVIFTSFYGHAIFGHCEKPRVVSKNYLTHQQTSWKESWEVLGSFQANTNIKKKTGLKTDPDRNVCQKITMKREEIQYKKQSQHAYQINTEIEFLGAQNKRLEPPKWVLGEVLGAEI